MMTWIHKHHKQQGKGAWLFFLFVTMLVIPVFMCFLAVIQGPIFIKLDQLDPSIEDQLDQALLLTILPQQFTILPLQFTILPLQ